ncbi:ABC transporter substrate-binding protein [Pseudomonas sp. GV071]|jgi:polar amino acid transport system substrate-binding protein|uniref:substrate-binding periplasmic protein n=1 Tax=Pseudomonas sp. GV071 TaxID=2135754 RepID=UPI000D37E777|nr:ABC transporter substrate-binding protein [Pseudomonas sp. GV071]PTQ71087.1 polar amino acid transport system substrate-binding protein [Pseudomonas sp. GV071]
MLKLLSRSLLLGLALVASAARAELPEGYEVVLLTENFPPFNMAVGDKNFARDEGIDGISAELVREMFKRADIKYNLTLRFPWDRLYKLTQDNANYGLFSTTRTEARQALFKWVGPLANTSAVILAKPGSTLKLNSLEEANQYKLGAYKNASVSQYLEGKGMTPVNALRDQENVSKLMEGKIDLWATTDPVGRYLAKQEGVNGLVTVLRFNDNQLFLALNLNTPDEVVQRLQKALDAMRADGTVDKISSSYL